MATYSPVVGKKRSEILFDFGMRLRRSNAIEKNYIYLRAILYGCAE